MYVFVGFDMQIVEVHTLHILTWVNLEDILV
jgi:hypothetical protein